MQPLKISKDIIPVSEFKAKAAEWLRRIAGKRGPVVITHNGKAAAVLLSPSEYDALTERARFVKSVEEGLADVEAGRSHSHEDVMVQMRSRFGTPEAQ